MDALILTGGLGTRLRPFTCNVPKPLLPVVNVPFLRYQLNDLKRNGIRRITLATAYRPEMFRRAFGNGKKLGLNLRYAREAYPLGTGGAVRNAIGEAASRTVVLNGDNLQHLDIRGLLKRHRKARALATIALTRVKDPTRYGLVETTSTGRIKRFLEKPSSNEITTDTINSGAYIFEPEIINMIPRNTVYSLERELFPALLQAEKRLFAFNNGGYWIDIGTIEMFLKVHLDLLSGEAPFRLEGSQSRGQWLLSPGAKIGADVQHLGRSGRIAVGKGTRIGSNVRFAGSVSIGPDCRIGDNSFLENCVLLEKTNVGSHARLERCIIGRNASIADQAHIGPGNAVADGSRIGEYSRL